MGTYQIWDDGEMLGKLPSNTEFVAEVEALGKTPGWRVYALVGGQRQDRGWVNGRRVSNANEAIEVTRREVCERNSNELREARHVVLQKMRSGFRGNASASRDLRRAPRNSRREDQMNKQKICAGCDQPIVGVACDWQSIKTGKTCWYCGDCDDKLIQDLPLPRDEVRSAAAVLGARGGSVSSPAKAEASRRNANGGKPLSDNPKAVRMRAWRAETRAKAKKASRT